MRKITITLLLSFSLFTCNSKKSEQQPPNIIFFLADDLGYGEVGLYGQQKIKTPNIDALGKNGMKFTQHYSGAPVCAPARYVFLTGKHMGHAYIRGNDEWSARGDVWDYEKAFKDINLEGQRPMPKNTVTIGKLLKESGYKTGVFGKWGLGAPETEGVPNLQGFDYFYGYNCQRQAHNLYPGHLWENTEKILLNNEIFSLKTKLDPQSDPYDEKSYAKFSQNDYAPEKIHEKALHFIADNKENPFFMYYASPLPHLPLQAPKAYVDEYRKEFGDEEPYLGNNSYFPNRYPRATYAAMISYLDAQLGELVAKLKAEGIYKNTIIIFSSDNGPTYLGGVDFNYFESSKPLSNGYGRTKGFVHEGGIRVPLIASWPNHIKPGTVTNHISAFYDLMPTICELANINPPEHIDGLSFKSTLLGQQQKQHDFLYWEFPSYKGQQAVRMGKWKGVRKNIFKGNLSIELYDLETDIKEQNNVSNLYPDIVKKIEHIMEQEHEPAINTKFKFKELGD
ncbi:arylsulfatase [Tamlana sp. 2201CG12-4]|uniref:arylsulfatase n=1 Tax=Tamlana sp. 2201CG12-4 TaxID=3112582 RepID=UPI002DBEC2BE|nr:arylsulfatase [Tamlana sp. 2201CG12-4]MEC3907320.1 arylsulfatase [Tamlana sp. 2201CG12-4]